MKIKTIKRSAEYILQKYASGERNFINSDIRGENFKKAVLPEIDLSGSDIRGTIFSGANLSESKFCNVEAGIPDNTGFILMILSFFVAFIGCICAAISEIFILRLLEPSILIYYPIPATIFSVVTSTLILYFVTLLSQQFSESRFFRLQSTLANLIAILMAAGGLTIGFFGFSIFILLKIKESILYEGIYEIVKYSVSILILAGTGQALVTSLSIIGIFSYLVFKFRLSELFFGVSFLGILVGILIVKESVNLVFLYYVFIHSIAPLLIGFHCCQGAIKCKPTWTSTKNAGVFFSCFFGTDFQGANLTQVNFSDSILRNTNFNSNLDKVTTLTHVLWKNVKNLEFARVRNSILTNELVRELLVTRYGYKKEYIDINLEGANLNDVNLQKAKLKRADLSGATLNNADLQEADLTETRVLGTDFTKARLTGVCIEGWNSDYTTKLEDVDCQYIYLLQNSKEPRPSSGNFAPGVFAKLNQKVLHTVDLIFNNGCDWPAFVTAFKQIQVDNEGVPLSIRSIEDKEDGLMVVRVNVPPDANKEKIHGDFNQHYERTIKALEAKYQGEIDHYRETNVTMLEFIFFLAIQPKTEIKMEGGDRTTNINSSSVNYVEHNSGTYVQGDYINMMSQDLTQAAGQIQNLIEQLQKQGKTVDIAQEQVAKDIATQAQRSPTVKEKLLKWGRALGDATVSDVVKGTVKLAIRNAGIPLP